MGVEVIWLDETAFIIFMDLVRAPYGGLVVRLCYGGQWSGMVWIHLAPENITALNNARALCRGFTENLTIRTLTLRIIVKYSLMK